MKKPQCVEDRGKFFEAEQIVPGGKSPAYVTCLSYECAHSPYNYIER